MLVAGAVDRTRAWLKLCRWPFGAMASDTGVARQASIGDTELGGLLAFGGVALLLATIPALLIYCPPVISGLG